MIRKLAQKKIKHLIVIEGPTASGKTSLSIALAKHFHTCILSADSRQFYRELSIGTAKPDAEEQDGVQHYFIDSHNLEDEVTAAQYEEEASALLDRLFQQHDVIILTGGSGMFIDSLCIGLDPIPASKDLREELTSQVESEGLDVLLNELRSKDPDFYQEVDRNNPARVIRAIEAMRLSGESFTSLRKKQPKKRSFKIHRFVIDHDREVLYDRINQRVDQMMEQGLLEEARSVHHLKELSSLKTVGYRELFDYFEGQTDLETAVNLIKMNTRRYAKRQLTWFRRHPEAHWIPFSDNATMSKTIVRLFEQEKTDSESVNKME